MGRVLGDRSQTGDSLIFCMCKKKVRQQHSLAFEVQLQFGFHSMQHPCRSAMATKKCAQVEVQNDYSPFPWNPTRWDPRTWAWSVMFGEALYDDKLQRGVIIDGLTPSTRIALVHSTHGWQKFIPGITN